MHRTNASKVHLINQFNHFKLYLMPEVLIEPYRDMARRDSYRDERHRGDYEFPIDREYDSAYYDETRRGRGGCYR